MASASLPLFLLKDKDETSQPTHCNSLAEELIRQQSASQLPLLSISCLFGYILFDVCCLHCTSSALSSCSLDLTLAQIFTWLGPFVILFLI